MGIGIIMAIVIFVLPTVIWVAWVIWTKLRGPSEKPVQKHSNAKPDETYDKAAFIQSSWRNDPPRSGGLF